MNKEYILKNALYDLLDKLQEDELLTDETVDLIKSQTDENIHVQESTVLYAIKSLPLALVQSGSGKDRIETDARKTFLVMWADKIMPQIELSYEMSKKLAAVKGELEVLL